MAIRVSAAVAALGLSALPAGFACDLPHPHLPANPAPKVLAPLWVGPAFSGTWFAPERSGEGISLQILDNGSALALWFTYPPVGGTGQQAWIYAQDGRIEGDRVIFDAAFTTRGPRFGTEYRAADLQLVPWGTFELRFSDCNTADLTYAGPSAWGSASRRLTRLTAYAELECTGKKQLTSANTRTLSSLKQRTALWYDPAHNGEGWVAEELPDGRTQFFWYSYDGNGDQAWMVGVSATSGNIVTIPDMYRPVGARFGSAFDANAVQRVAWGNVSVAFATCDSGVVAYGSPQPGFGSGMLQPLRVTKLAGTACINATPGAPTSGTWSSGPSMPTAQSEVATSAYSSTPIAYVGGGFGDPRAFYRYDALNGTWLTLARIPGARDHALMVAFGNEVLHTGGYSQADGDQVNPGWRYSTAQDRWEAAPELPFVAASSGAQLGGFAYFGTLSGDLFQYNPRTRTSRAIASPRNVARDHSQLVAFQGELFANFLRSILIESNGSSSRIAAHEKSLVRDSARRLFRGAHRGAKFQRHHGRGQSIAFRADSGASRQSEVRVEQ